jgi:hypothetical protein
MSMTIASVPADGALHPCGRVSPSATKNAYVRSNNWTPTFGRGTWMCKHNGRPESAFYGRPEMMNNGTGRQGRAPIPS